MSWLITGGRTLLGGEIAANVIAVSGGTIVSAAQTQMRPFDVAGALVLPGIVDVHGDGFERQIQPRPGVNFPIDVALIETDRQLILNGITTAFHGLTVSWEPGLRSVETARTFVATLERIRPRLSCDTRLHLRWETFALDALEEVLAWAAREEGAIFAINDHTTSMLERRKQEKNLPQWAARTGLSQDDYLALLEDIWARRSEVEDAIADVAARALKHGAVLFAHDEASPEDRLKFRSLGITASEFPMTAETARVARNGGEHTILGAPNVVRGGSHTGAINAAEAVEAGLCSVLASDYYYPSQLLAAFKLAADGRAHLASAWDLVSKNAAEASGLTDRGVLEPGWRADIVVVDDQDPALPQVVAVFVGGRLVLDRRSAFVKPNLPLSSKYTSQVL